MHLIALSPVLLFSYFLRVIGLRGLEFTGSALGLFFYALGFRKSIVSSNLRLAYGNELNDSKMRALTKEIYRNVGKTFLGIARNFTLPRESVLQEVMFRDEDRARVNAALARGKGLVFLSAHIANWELLAMGVAAHGFLTSIVVKKMNNRISQALIERQRRRTGLGVIYSGGTIAKMKAELSQGRVIGFMVDQNTTGKKGIRANFFGVPASSIRGLAGLVKDTGTAVIPICAYRQANGRHQIELLPEIPYIKAPELPEGSEERALREEWLNTQAYQSAIETLVRRHPEQWLWIHRRWKTNREPLDLATVHLENRE